MVKFIRIFGCVLIVLLDVAAFILAIKGDAAQNQGKAFRVWIFEWKDPFALGLAAAILLVIAHVVAILLGGCFTLRNKKDCNARFGSIISLIGSWIMVAFGLSMLVMGIISTRKSSGFPHYLYKAGKYCLYHCFLFLAYYPATRESTVRNSPPQL